jgi:MFS family permease
VVLENPTAFPRAWVVPHAATLAAGKERETLGTADFTRTVLIAGEPPPSPPAGPTTARVADYRPNRVAVRLDGPGGGFLVLADVWFPGWVCRVDGAEVPVYRANHAFRAVAIPPGVKEAVFSFEPRSYRVGWWVSMAALVAIVLAILAWGLTIAVFGLVASLALACLMLALAGAADNISAVFRSTILQAATPDEYRGRLQGIFTVVVAGGPRLGDVESGTVAALFGETFSVVSGGVLCIVTTLALVAAVPTFLKYDAKHPVP